MSDFDSYTKEIEAQDLAVTEFLSDLDIALGHDYRQPGKQLFAQLFPEFHSIVSSELPLFERLALAYKALEESRKPHARLIVRRALVRCARTPLGLRRSLACLDLAHEIDPSLGSEELYSDLMLRPTDTGELAEWLWQLIRRWNKWNVKVVSSPQRWKVAIEKIAPKGILELLRYFHAQNASNAPECWKTLRRIALKRIEEEQAALIDVGYDPDILKERISSLMLSSESHDEQYDSVCADPQVKERESLLQSLRKSLQQLSAEKIKDEIGWIDLRGGAWI